MYLLARPLVAIRFLCRPKFGPCHASEDSEVHNVIFFLWLLYCNSLNNFKGFLKYKTKTQTNTLNMRRPKVDIYKGY